MKYRVEDKYVLPLEQLFLLEQRIQAIMTLDQGSFKSGYKISSLYFDDISDTCLRDTIDGNPCRSKYRIRVYNDSLSMIKLEVKTKVYNRCNKIGEEISQEEMKKLILGETIESNSHMQSARNLFNLAIQTRYLKPKLNVTYDRKAYICETGNVRITFDRNIRANDQINMFPKPELVYDYPDDFGCVLEVKYDEVLPHYIAQTLEINKLVQTSNSKYGICREIYERRIR